MAAPIPTQSFTVPPEWVDYNGHLNMGFYVVAFDFKATDPMYAWLGLGEDYIAERNMSVFSISSRTDYMAEMFEGDVATIDTMMLDFDGRRMHYFHQMYNAAGKVTATNELVAINVNLEHRKSAPVPDDLADNIRQVVAAHSFLTRPRHVGRKIGLR